MFQLQSLWVSFYGSAYFWAYAFQFLPPFNLRRCKTFGCRHTLNGKHTQKTCLVTQKITCHSAASTAISFCPLQCMSTFAFYFTLFYFTPLFIIYVIGFPLLISATFYTGTTPIGPVCFSISCFISFFPSTQKSTTRVIVGSG